ncbi:MAG: hypothetical protein ACRD0J_17685, partial [Acidimicrobiales bacterium]
MRGLDRGRQARPGAAGPPRAAEGVWLAGAGVLVALSGAVWASGELAGRLAHGIWPGVPAGQAAGLAFRLAEHLGRPALAWPVGARELIPGPVAYYAILAVTAGGPVVLAGIALRAWRRRGPGVWTAMGGPWRRAGRAGR